MSNISEQKCLVVGLGVMLFCLAAQAGADALDLSLNDDAVRLQYERDNVGRGFRVDAGWLHHQDRGDVIHVGFHITGDASSGDAPLIGGLGGKIFHIDPDGAAVDATVLGLGGFFRYTFPDYDRFNVYGHAYLAPDILSFGDGDRYQEVELRLSYNVLRNADVFVGARYSNTEFEPAGDLTSDNGLHVGMQLRF